MASRTEDYKLGKTCGLPLKKVKLLSGHCEGGTFRPCSQLLMLLALVPGLLDLHTAACLCLHHPTVCLLLDHQPLLEGCWPHWTRACPN